MKILRELVVTIALLIILIVVHSAGGWINFACFVAALVIVQLWDINQKMEK